jgi:modulator of FtsH protease HflK
VANRARDLMQAIHDRYGTGVLVSTVTIQNAQPPEQVQAAFDDAVKAGQDRERQKNEGQAYANDVIPRARGTASRLQQEADGYRQRVIASAEGDASRFRQVLTEYAKAPAVTRERIYIETMQQVLASTSKIMMDYRGSGNLLYLPLDKLMQSSGQAGEGAAQPRPLPAEPAPDAGPRSRETLRNRDRGDR